MKINVPSEYRERRWRGWWGELTWSARPHGIYLYVSSGGGDSERGARFCIAAWRLYLLLWLPNWVLRPEIKHHPARTYSGGTQMGAWHERIERQYGFTYSDGFLNVQLGRNTHDSSTEQRWGYFLPWLQWRHVRHSLYDDGGRHFADMGQHPRLGESQDRWRKEMQLRDSCPVVRLWFLDHDGELIQATTRIEERQWERGTGRWWSWLSVLWPSKISRSLDLEFSAEVGARKGSWKGGTIGHSAEMVDAMELHESAFRRYCEQHKLTYIGHLTVAHLFKIEEIVKSYDPETRVDGVRIYGEGRYMHADRAWLDQRPRMTTGHYFVQSDNGCVTTYMTRVPPSIGGPLPPVETAQAAVGNAAARVH